MVQDKAFLKYLNNIDNKEKIINFKYTPTPNMKVRISRDFNVILFTDDKEKFYL